MPTFSLAVANNGFAGYTTPVLSIGRGNNANNTVNAAMNGVLHAGYVWKDRTLTSAEAASLYLDPFQMFDVMDTFDYSKILKTASTSSTANAGSASATASGFTLGETRTLPTAFNP